MTISELIGVLHEYQSQYGDIEVVLRDRWVATGIPIERRDLSLEFPDDEKAVVQIG